VLAGRHEGVQTDLDRLGEERGEALGQDEHWIYRRDPSVRVPWDVAVLRTAGGVPYLAPALQLLYKSTGRRPKDEVDAAEVIPALDARQRSLLSQLLDANDPWRRHLS
jgi:hypothetical protein